MTVLRADTEAPEPALVAATYKAALQAYVVTGNEEDLSSAYDCARLALRAGVSIGEVGELHFRAAQHLRSAPLARAQVTARIEEFFLETISVYDMALHGYGESVARLTAEVQERKRVEEELRDVTFELAQQRDLLDQQVKDRTAQLRSRLEELRMVNSQLQQTNQEQAQFSYAISHDLKSPVNTLMMMLDLLEADHREVLDAEGRELLDAARATTRRMAHMVQDVLRYARLVGQEAEVEMVGLTPLCQTVLADLRAETQKAGAEIRIDPLPVVRGVASQLHSLFLNLLSNAVKFRHPTRPCRIEVKAVPPVGCVAEIHVCDNGIGIDPAYQQRIFSLFQRLHTYEEYSGSGIGLTLCQRIAGYHHGDIRVSSTPGEGACFIIRLWVEES